MREHPHHAALKRAVEAAGNNQSLFAREIGASQQRVSYWLNNGRPLPGEFVIPAERAGFGSRHVIRPDLYPTGEAAVAMCGRCDVRAEDPHVTSCTAADCPMRERNAA